jgi:hypothetical protein
VTTTNDRYANNRVKLIIACGVAPANDQPPGGGGEERVPAIQQHVIGHTKKSTVSTMAHIPQTSSSFVGLFDMTALVCINLCAGIQLTPTVTG